MRAPRRPGLSEGHIYQWSSRVRRRGRPGVSDGAKSLIAARSLTTPSDRRSLQKSTNPDPPIRHKGSATEAQHGSQEGVRDSPALLLCWV